MEKKGKGKKDGETLYFFTRRMIEGQCLRRKEKMTGPVSRKGEERK